MAPEGHLLPYRLKTVRTAVLATVLVVPPLAALPFLGDGAVYRRAPYLATLAVALVGMALLNSLPWARIFRHRRGMLAMYAWSILDILLISALIVFSGGSDSDLVWVYVLTTFFLAATYRPRVQLLLMVVTFACYAAAVALGGGPIVSTHALLAVAVLGILTFMVGFLSGELMEQMTAHAGARAESERRARMLQTVAHAAAPMSSLDADAVLDAVSRAAISLGYDGAVFNVIDPSGETYTVAHAMGVPATYAAKRYPQDAGIQAVVREQGRTIVVEDYGSHPEARAVLVDAGFRCGVATPVWADGRVVAVLAVGYRRPVEIGSDEVGALELLAAHAGRALENAERFDAERRTVERMAELDRMKGDFLSNVSHELRTPLTVIEGIASTLHTRWERLDDDKRRGFVARLYSNALALDEVISTLLDFNQLETGRIEVRAQLVDLGELVDRAASRLGALFDHGALTTDTSDAVVVRGDPALLDRVVENLLSNAAKHTPRGTSVHVRITRADGHAEVSVEDRGPGIPSDEVAHLGERFFRGGETNTRRTRGVGIGLAFVREVLALHESSLDVESEPGRGSRFAFRMPVAADRLVPGAVA